MAYKYFAEVIRIVDGDTIDLDVDLGFNIHFKERFRLSGINAPEIYSTKKDSEEYKKGMETVDFLCKYLPISTQVEIETEKDKKEKYGRYLAEVHFTYERARRNLNTLLIELGLAVVAKY